ncbi:MAG: DPP IV N-terminal domain-containing protein [Bacteroidales bacterium]|nr:DPP IV N-terminal domain-containing protein [Bacteroidales bacterium]
MKRTFLTLMLLTLGWSAGAQQAPNYEAAARFSTKKISQMVHSTTITPAWFQNSDKFWYSWKSPEGTHYYIVDPTTGTKTEAFDMEKLAMEITSIVHDPFDAQHLPIQSLELKDDKAFRFDIRSTKDVPDTTATAKKGPKKMTKKVYHFEYDLASGKLSEYKPEEKKYPRWVSVSPDGKTGVFMKNSNLFWMDEENMAKAAKDEKDSTIVEHRLTSDGTREHGYGFGNYHGNTETDTTKRHMAAGIAWSPDSKHFAIMKYDMSMIKELWVINSVKGPRPELETYKYQMPGEPGPQEQLYIFNMEDGSHKTIRTNAWKDQQMAFETQPRTAKDAYKKYYSTIWLGDNDGFYANRVSRDLKKIDYVRIDIASDSTKTLISERMNSFIEGRDLRLIKNGTQIIEWSERNGWANLYLYTSDGKLIRNLTEGAYHVSDIVSVNEKENYVLFIACGVQKGENPYHEHLYKVSLNGGPIKKLDVDDMDHKAIGSDDGKYAVLNYSRVDAEPQVALVDGNGKLTHLETADLSKLYEAGYKMPERFTVKAADGVTDLYGVMYKPFDFDPSKKYPIIEYVYPGPQVEANNISWSKGMLRVDRLAQIGFIVITVGNRGGHPDRSKWYHNFGYGNLRDYGLEDQKVAVERLAARYPFIDASRVGIHGHSGGGFMSTAAILKYPDFYKAAVSCAGNHDNSIYNRWWSEQHHGILEQISEKGDTTFLYKIATNPQIAGNLKGHLMLVHGDIDNNVHPANTIRVVDALIRANKRFDMLILPGQRHGFGDMNEYFFYRLADYFSEWLLEDSERDRVDVTWLNND